MKPQAMTEIPGFVLTGAIRSKKTSCKFITIPTKGSRRCPVCGKMPGFPKIIPSDAHAAWHEAAMQQLLGIKAELARRGLTLPITGLVNVEALFYQDVDRADAVGLYESLGDLLQDAQVIGNDRQVASWDGSQRLRDGARPRVEVYITVIEERAVQQVLAGDE